jgi:hypothetical protein
MHDLLGAEHDMDVWKKMRWLWLLLLASCVFLLTGAKPYQLDQPDQFHAVDKSRAASSGSEFRIGFPTASTVNSMTRAGS